MTTPTRKRKKAAPKTFKAAYDILKTKERKNCLCTGMLFDPEWETEKKKDEGTDDEQKFFSKFKKIKKLIWKK